MAVMEMHEYPVYEEMKDSGSGWIKLMPKSWALIPLKYIFSIKKDIAGETGHTVLSVTQKGIIPKDMSSKGQFALDYSKYQLVNVGDFVMNHMDLLTGWVDISVYDGVTSPDYRVFVNEHPERFISEYYKYIFQYCYTNRVFYGLGQGVAGFGRWRLPAEMFLNFNLPVPSCDEQAAIAAYLDDQCGKIDALIAQTKESIEEYKKWKQSIIFEAVTKGLDPDVEMKDSGTEFGNIPRNWNVLRLKNIATSIYKGNGITRDDVVDNGDIHCVRYGEIYTLYNYFFRECRTKTNEENVASKRYFSYGDILFAGTGELVEEIGKNIAYLGPDVCLAGGDIIVVKHKQDPVFLSYALNSRYGQSQKERGRAKLKVVHISAFDISNIIVFLPPLEEQIIIAEYLNEKCSMIDEIISGKTHLISELESYKHSLIYEAVTGKRKVVAS